MQLPDKSGVGCDKCGLACRQDFTYYNLDCRRVDVYGQRPDYRAVLRLPVIKSFDLCSSCFDALSRLVLENYKSYQQSKRQLCEVSGTDLTGQPTHYHVDVQRANVSTSNQPYVCVACRKTSMDSKQCGCGSTKFVRPAKVKVEKDIVQFNIHPCVFEQWSVHKPKQSDWDTRS